MDNCHQEISSLKSVFKSKGYPKNFIESCIKHFLDKLFVKNKVSLTVPKLQLVCVLPNTHKSSFDLRAHLRCTIEKDTPFCKLSVVFRSTCRLGNLFRFKGYLEEKTLSTPIGVVTARLLITEKHSDIFLLERLSIWELGI